MYKEEKEFNVLKGQIPDFGYDIKMLSVIVDGKKSTNIPSRGLYKTSVECSGGTTGEWDYNAWNLIINNAESNSKCNISFTSNLTQEEYDKYIEAGKALRRNTYRGKDITSYHTDGSLYEMISSGRFDDIYVGDYITVNNIKWLVADIDNYLYTGYKEGAANSGSLTSHHATIIPAKPLVNAAMNPTLTTEGGYYNSNLKQNTLVDILSAYVEPVFKDHILTYNTLFTNSINTSVISQAGLGWLGASNSTIWHESKIDLMSEINVYGFSNYSSSPYDAGIDTKQYAIFQLKSEFINTDGTTSRFNYWLSSVCSATSFVSVHNAGGSSWSGAISENGVRPRFLIG